MTGERPQRGYEIRVRGHLGQTLLRAFPDLEAKTDGGDTLLSGPLPDQAAVHGVLAQIASLGLELLEVRQLSGESTTSTAQPRSNTKGR